MTGMSLDSAILWVLVVVVLAVIIAQSTGGWRRKRRKIREGDTGLGILNRLSWSGPTYMWDGLNSSGARPIVDFAYT